MNAEVSLGATYDEQKDLKKVFYLYERHNEDGNGAEIKITYTVNSSKGEVVVPFRKTSDTREFVDVERNTLYTVVLGNGDPVTTNEVKFSLRIEDWNVVDMDEAVDPDEDEQMKRNKALKSICSPRSTPRAWIRGRKRSMRSSTNWRFRRTTARPIPISPIRS